MARALALADLDAQPERLRRGRRARRDVSQAEARVAAGAGGVAELRHRTATGTRRLAPARGPLLQATQHPPARRLARLPVVAAGVTDAELDPEVLPFRQRHGLPAVSRVQDLRGRGRARRRRGEGAQHDGDKGPSGHGATLLAGRPRSATRVVAERGAWAQARVPTAIRYSISKRARVSVPWFHSSQNRSSASSNSASRPLRRALPWATMVG